MSGGAARLAAVRRFTRDVRPPVPLARRADTAYAWAITAAIFGVLLYGVAARALAAAVTPAALAVGGPIAGLIVLTAAVRWGALLGPVVFSRPDVAHLLDAPLPRRRLGVGRLARGLALGALGGAVLGTLATIGVAGDGRGIEPAPATALIGGTTLLGVLAVALAQAVAVSARWQRPALWLLPLLTVAAVVAALLGADWLPWSGPWGWAVAPGTDTTAWLSATAALAVLAVVAAVAALRAAGAGSTERHERRARLRARLGAATTAYDARGARLLLRERDADPHRAPAARDTAAARGGAAGTGPAGWHGRVGRLRRGLARPADARWTTAWRHALRWAARPVGPAVAVVLAAAAGAAAAQVGDDAWWGLAVGALSYGAVAGLLEPLRAEIDVPQRALLLLGTPVERLAEPHLVAPVALVGAGTLAGAVVALIAGGGCVAAAALAVLAVPVVAYCAARSAQRGGRLPQEVLFTAVASDPSGGGFFLTLYAVAWPLTAAVTVTVALALAAAGPSELVLLAVTLLAAAGVILRALVRW